MVIEPLSVANVSMGLWYCKNRGAYVSPPIPVRRMIAIIEAIFIKQNKA